MRIYFVRHGLTPLTGFVQGQSDKLILNELEKEGTLAITESAAAILQELISLGTDYSHIYLFTPNLKRTLQTSELLISQLGLNPEQCFIDNRLTGRNYGKLNGLDEYRIKSPKYILSHPGQALSYAAAEFGIPNKDQIEPKTDFKSRIADFIHSLFHYSEQDDVIIISANSDMWKLLIKDERYNDCTFSTKEKLEAGEYAYIDIPPEKFIQFKEEAKNYFTPQSNPNYEK